MADPIDKTQIIVKLDGAGLTPDTVKASDLAEFLVSIEKAILEVAFAQGLIKAQEAKDEAIVSLVAVSEGSDTLTFSLSLTALPAMSTITAALSDGDFSKLPAPAHSTLHEISKQATKKRWKVDFLADEGVKVRPATISASTPVHPPKILEVRGETTLYGRLIRVGGVTPRAMLMLEDGSILYIQITEIMAIEIASDERLYKEIGLDGEATWRTDTWEIVSFRATQLLPYQPHKMDLVKTFEALAEAAGGRWDNIDPVDFVNHVRRGGDE